MRVGVMSGGTRRPRASVPVLWSPCDREAGGDAAPPQGRPRPRHRHPQTPSPKSEEPGAQCAERATALGPRLAQLGRLDHPARVPAEWAGRELEAQETVWRCRLEVQDEGREQRADEPVERRPDLLEARP